MNFNYLSKRALELDEGAKEISKVLLANTTLSYLYLAVIN